MVNNDFKKILKYLKKSNVITFSQSDDDVSKSLTGEITNRDSNYTIMLEDYITLTHFRGICKEIHKWIFFWLVVAGSVFGIIYSIKLMNRVLSAKEISTIMESIPVLITAIVSLVSTVIVVPVSIAKFLFNTKEDDNITTLIKHTQDHDSAGMNLLKEKIISKSDKTEPKLQLSDDDEH